ncbi:serine/threonine-protein kinase [Nannocystis sp. SCPEA4]|uniref:serine/threonine-protein kinase n=1 Tax=Nannocystis sp. SCPEA4 TaxID=2996787 RepID=UPI00226FD098|nr:serine/threonine-protein kinase [Nannocystis sp. SCPEA4]
MQDSLPVGTLIDDRYRLVRLLRKGGMGEIYAAEHIHTHRRVAIKVLREPWSRDPVTRERFKREAQATSQIVHEHIVEMLDFGVTADGACYLVMELLYGEDLQATLLREGRLPLRRAAAIILQICSALAEAHRHGIIHRDLKPGNCFRTGFRGVQDFIKLVDFGIAKRLPRAAEEQHDSHDGAALTTEGTILGTIFYMAPEQSTGGPIDHRIDVYAAGVVLFQLVTGKLPFRGNTPNDTYRMILTAEVPSARKLAPEAELPAAIDELFRKALHKNPDKRFASMDELADAVATVAAQVPKDRSKGESAVLAVQTAVADSRRGLQLVGTVALAAALVTALAIALYFGM